MYKRIKKTFEKSGELPPFAAVFTSKKLFEPGQRDFDLGEFPIPIEIITTQYGSAFEMPIDTQDDESKEMSMAVVQVLAETVEADFVLIVGEALARLDESEAEVTEVILVSFQSLDGSYNAQIPILRKGKKVRLPNSLPPLTSGPLRCLPVEASFSQ